MDEINQINAIATACGWKRHKTQFGHEWESPEGLRGYQEREEDHGGPYTVFRPDYTSSNTAITAAILAQDNFGFKLRFVAWLELIVIGKHITHKERDSSMGRFALYNATPAQKCEAFLQALDLWTT